MRRSGSLYIPLLLDGDKTKVLWSDLPYATIESMKNLETISKTELLLLTETELRSELASGRMIPMPWLLCFTLGLNTLSNLQAACLPCVVVAGIIRNADGHILIAQRSAKKRGGNFGQKISVVSFVGVRLWVD